MTTPDPNTLAENIIEKLNAGAALVYALYHAPADWWTGKGKWEGHELPQGLTNAYMRATDAYDVGGESKRTRQRRKPAANVRGVRYSSPPPPALTPDEDGAVRASDGTVLAYVTAESGPMTSEGWFADLSDEDERNPDYPWQPFLQTDGCCFPLPVWFATEADCLAFIGESVAGRGLLDPSEAQP